MAPVLKAMAAGKSPETRPAKASGAPLIPPSIGYGRDSVIKLQAQELLKLDRAVKYYREE